MLSGFLGCLNELRHQFLVLRVLIQVGLGNLQCRQDLRGVIILGNLWENELLLVDFLGICLERRLLMAFLRKLLRQILSLVEVIEAQSLAEYIPLLIHFLDLFVNLGLILVFENSQLLLGLLLLFLDSHIELSQQF